MGFFDAVGDIINPKNLATVGGFLAGGPAGAAAGRGIGGAAFGDNWDPTDDGSFGQRLGSGVQGGIEGAAMGFGGQALGLGGAGASGGAGAAGGGASSIGASALPPAASVTTPASFSAASAPAAGVGAAGAGAAAASEGGGGLFSDALADLNSYEKLMLGSQAVGAAGNVYGAIEQGQMEDERRRRSRRFSNTLAPYVRDMMQGVYN